MQELINITKTEGNQTFSVVLSYEPGKDLSPDLDFTVIPGYRVYLKCIDISFAEPLNDINRNLYLDIKSAMEEAVLEQKGPTVKPRNDTGYWQKLLSNLGGELGKKIDNI